MVHRVRVVLTVLAFFVIVTIKKTANKVFLSARTVALTRAAAPPLPSHVSRTAAALTEYLRHCYHCHIMECDYDVALGLGVRHSRTLLLPQLLFLVAQRS